MSSTDSHSGSTPQCAQAKQLQLQAQQARQELVQRREREVQQLHKQQRMQQQEVQHKQQASRRELEWSQLRQKTYDLQHYQRERLRAAEACGTDSPKAHVARERLLQLRAKQRELRFPPRLRASDFAFGRWVVE